MLRGVVCALDGFLVEPFQTTPLPGVVESFPALQARGLRVAVATIQAGPVWRAVTGQEHYPTVDQVAARLREAAGRLGLEGSPWYIALFDGRALRTLRASELDAVLRGMPERLREALDAIPAELRPLRAKALEVPCFASTFPVAFPGRRALVSLGLDF